MDTGLQKVHARCALFPIDNNEHLVTGKVATTNYYFCTTARGAEDMCGTEGKLFVKRKNERLDKEE
jgi:hypothetical protein